MFLVPEAGFDVVGEAADGAVALERARALHPDVVLMDLMLPGMTGVEATAAIRSEVPGVKVVVLTSVGDESAIAQAVQAGAAAYLLKESSGHELRQALRAVAARPGGEAARRRRGRGHPPGLSERELAVLAGLTQGKANKEIARELGVSLETVKTYVRRILQKLGVHTRTEAAVRALSRDLLR